MPELNDDNRMIHLHFTRGDEVIDEIVPGSEVENFLKKYVNRPDEIADALMFLEVNHMTSGRFVGAGWTVSFVVEDP